MTNIWGPEEWRRIHTTAKYTDLRKPDFVTYIYGLRQTLPCGECRTHFASLLEEFPLRGQHLKDNRAAFEWTVFVHNKVNERLGKPKYDVETAWKLY